MVKLTLTESIITLLAADRTATKAQRGLNKRELSLVKRALANLPISEEERAQLFSAVSD